jgi:high-affinity nickel-transport protein
LYTGYVHGPVGAGTGTLAYVLGIRHAFDADHIAAIDDTTRLMMQRGRRPVGVGFFFAMGHSSVVVALSLVVALAAGAATRTRLEDMREVGGAVSTVVAMLFLALVAALNAVVLSGIVRLWRRLRQGRLDERELEPALLDRGLVNRILGARARALIRSSWHMYPLGFLFGLGLETASEITLLTLSASTAQAGTPALPAVLSLPLLFAAGMSAFDTCDSLVMARAYSWSYRSPARRLYYNIATTAMTVAVAGFVASVYLAGVLAEHAGAGFLGAYARIGDHFELLGYCIVAGFVLAWLGAAVLWRVGGFQRRYGPSS